MEISSGTVIETWKYLKGCKSQNLFSQLYFFGDQYDSFANHHGWLSRLFWKHQVRVSLWQVVNGNILGQSDWEFCEWGTSHVQDLQRDRTSWTGVNGTSSRGYWTYIYITQQLVSAGYISYIGILQQTNNKIPFEKKQCSQLWIIPYKNHSIQNHLPKYSSFKMFMDCHHQFYSLATMYCIGWNSNMDDFNTPSGGPSASSATLSIQVAFQRNAVTHQFVDGGGLDLGNADDQVMKKCDCAWPCLMTHWSNRKT